MKTVLEVITATTAYFTRSGIENPRLNIEHLLAHVMGKRRMDLYLQFDRRLEEKELDPLRDLVRRRAQGEPLQHLLGTVEFLGLTLKCDRRALIPRPETEQLCEILVEEAKSADCTWKAGRVVDVGTGSGCIALALASSIPTIQVTGVDISEDALALARENLEKIGLAERVTFAKSDLLGSVKGPFDLVVANLPYIPSNEVPELQAEVQRDPIYALNGGGNGLEIIRRLLSQVCEKMKSGGRLALEIGLGQVGGLVAEFTARNFQDVKIMKDYQSRDRFIFATYG